MSGNGGFWDNPFGGFFDFNGDGKEDLSEQYLAFKIFEDMTKEEEDNDSFDDDLLFSDEMDDDDAWRDENFYEGLEYGIDPYDYDSREDFEEDLENAMINSAESRSASASKAYTSQGRLFTPRLHFGGPYSQKLPANDTANAPAEEKVPLTYDDYCENMSQSVSSAWQRALLTLLICAVACVCIWAAYKVSEVNKGNLIAVIIVIAGIIILFRSLKAGILGIKRNIADYNKTKEAFVLSTSDEEKEHYRISKKKRWIARGIGLGLALLAIAAVLLAQYLWVVRTYSKAEEQILNGQYDEATSLLLQIEDKKYKDTDALLKLCDAEAEYEDNQFINAYNTMKDAKFNNLSEDMLNEVNRFNADLKNRYDNYIAKDAK